MSAGKYQVRQANHSRKFVVYCITNNEDIAVFRVKARTDDYAKFLNGEPRKGGK
jgi:hypothetical protein